MKEICDVDKVFESSIDFVFGKGIKRVRKGELLLYEIDSSSEMSCQLLNYVLILIRFNLIYSKMFYKFNRCLTMLMLIHNNLTMILCLIVYSIFEMFYKQMSMISLSMNIYSLLFILSLFISILFLSLTNHFLFSYGYFIYFKQKQSSANQVDFLLLLTSNIILFLKLIRLSSLDDRYLKNIRFDRPLLLYVLIVVLSVLCQFPYLMLTLKYVLSNLIDYLLIVYLFVFILYIVVSLLILMFLCLFPLEFISKELNEIDQTKSFDRFSK